MCLETAEICSKVLDWRSNSDDANSLGEFITCKFLLFVEEIAVKLHGESKLFISENTRLKNLMMEIYKRILNLTEMTPSVQDI